MKDPKQFRERFKKWKEGTPIEEIYDHGRPTYFESVELLASPMAKNWTNIKEEFKPSAKYVGTAYSNGKDDRTYIGGSNQELVVTPGKSWVNPYTGEYTQTTESYAQPIASKDPYVDYQFYSPTGNSIVQTINSTPRWQQYWADREGGRVSNAMHQASPKVLDLLTAVDAVATGPEMLEGLYGLYNLTKKHIYAPYKISKALNKAVKNNSIFETTSLPNAKVRTKLGDVEIDNPQLAYRQIDKKAVDDFLNSGQVRTPEGDYAKSTTVTTKRGFTFDFGGKTFDNPMFALGRLWYGIPTKKDAGLLVTSEPLGVATKGSSLVRDLRNGTFDLRYPDVGKAGRRVLLEEGQLNLLNTSAYIFDPNYGYRKVILNVPTAEFKAAPRTPKITEANATSITPEQWTTAQDAAIARGNMEEAQRLRDLHFKTYAHNTKINVPLWSSSEEAFNSFDLSHFGETDSGFFGYGHYLTPMEKYAATYHPVNRRFYVNMENPYIGSNDQYFNRIQYVKDRLALRKENVMRNLRDGKLTKFSKKLGINENTSLEDAERLVDKYVADETIKWNDKYIKYADEFEGKDGVLSWRELQGVPNKQEGIYREVVVPRGEQIKSADAITYDDNGVRIPLGLRDNFNLNDIRYGLIPLGFGLGAATLPNKYARGKDSGIYIKPSKRGTFTAAAKKRGMSVLSFVSKVLNNPSNYSKAMRKKALFAKNASKFKH